MKKYQTIYADPPWDYDMSLKRHVGKAVRSLASDYYDCMTMDELYKLPVGELADINAHMYLWTTNAFMHEAHHLVEAWGFRPITLVTWVKDKIGMGYYFRQQTEHVIFGVKGSLPTKKHSISTVFHAKRYAHSAKPLNFYEIIEAMSPPPYIELFAREHSPMFPKRDGWDCWGNEVEGDIEL